MKDSRYKVHFVYKEDQEFKVEGVWAKKIGDNYEIDNIPFFINSIALGDIVSVEFDDEKLYFDSLVNASGNSTIHLISFKSISNQSELGVIFEDLGCSWEGSHIKEYISINIPKAVNYELVKQVLEKGYSDKDWDYREACISDNHMT